MVENKIIDKEKGEEIKAKETEKTNILKKNPWIITTAILTVLVIISFVFLLKTPTGKITGNVISKSEAGELTLNLFNSMLSEIPGTLDSVKEVSGIYQVAININGQKALFYITKDGKFIYPGMELKSTKEIIEQTAEKGVPEEIPKADKPVVELFVMSFCPFGNRAEGTMLPIYNLLKDKADWNIHYIVNIDGDTINSLHGQPEVNQDEREACVLNEYGLDKWWAFITYVNENCGADGECWEDAAKEAKLDVNKIKSCVSEKGLELMKADEEISNSVGASGSPTLIINGAKTNEVYKYENPEAYKQIICSAFNTPPDECSEELASVSTSSSTSGGSC